MIIEMVNISKLKPHPKNPRIHPNSALERLTKSIKEYGWTNPILVSEDGFVLAGHVRLKAAEKVGLKEVPVIYLPLSGAKAEAYMIADNKLQDMTDWDFPKLKDILEELDTGNLDIEVTGFDLKEIEDLMTQFHIPEEGLIPDDEIPEKVELVCKIGQLWQLGEHCLLCGDATKKEDVDRLIGGEKADMVFTDPPYGIDLDTDYTSYKSPPKAQLHFVRGKAYPKLIGDAVKFNPVFLLSYFEKVDEIFLWGADYYHHSLPEFGHFLVWDKSTDDADKMLGSSFEICWSKQPHKKEVARIFYRGAFGATADDGRRCHPTQKPVRLALWFFERWGKKSNIIVDLYGGSGSTLIACEKLGRRCFMMEIDQQYCDVIITRWQNFTGHKAELLNGGNRH